MTKTKNEDAKTYYNPRFTQTPPKEWLKTRDKHPTGFCNPYQPLKGQGHEGDKVNRRVCDFWESCPCYCHYQIDQMYEMIGMPRPPAEQSHEYAMMLSELRLETQAMLESLPTFGRFSGPLFSPDGPDTCPDAEGPVTPPETAHTGTSAPPATALFAPTPTGRRARGQLEYDVLLVCMEFAADKYEWEYCTPKLVSEEIGSRYAIEPPSTGAINAVWDRWEKLGVAEQAKKPSRLVRFLIDDLDPVKLDRIKAQNKAAKKRGELAQRRGIPRVERRK